MNTLAPVNIPALKLPGLTWIIASVEFLKGFGGGTLSRVTLMPKEAFEPEPSFYSPFDPQVAAATREALKTRNRSARDLPETDTFQDVLPGDTSNANPKAGEGAGI